MLIFLFKPLINLTNNIILKLRHFILYKKTFKKFLHQSWNDKSGYQKKKNQFFKRF